jgi:hypothetical protein
MSTTGSNGEADAAAPSEAVVSVVAAHKGVDEMALPPLYEVLDPDALDALFATRGDGNGSVTFDYAGCTVEWDSDDGVVVSE